VVGRSGFIRKVAAVVADQPAGDPPPDIAGSLGDFLRALSGGTTPMGECHDNINSLAMVAAALESARRHQRVEIAEILEATPIHATA
jgi:predicted dehydrogenase